MLTLDPEREYVYSFSDYLELPNLQPSYFLIDAEGDQWVSTLNNGVYFIPQVIAEPYGQVVDPTIELFVNNRTLWAAWKDKGAGTYHEGNRYLVSDFTDLAKFYTIDSVTWIMVGAKKLNTVLFDAHTRTSSSLFPSWEQIIIRNSTYWIGSTLGFKVLSDFVDVQTSFSQDHEKLVLGENKVRDPINAIESFGEHCLIASQRGLVLYDSDLDTIISYPEFHNQNIVDLSSYSVEDLTWYWLYTGDTIYGFSSKQDTLIVANEAPNSFTVNRIQQINDTLLGVSSDYGLQVFQINFENRSLKQLIRLSQSNGLSHSQVNDFLLLHDTLFIATDHGVSFSPLERIRSYSVIPPPSPLIKRVLVDGKIREIGEVIRVPLGNQDVEIVHTGIQYRSLGQIQFRYRINEEGSWKVTSQPKQFFTNLGSGSYHYEVQAKGIEGGWSEQSAHFDFVVVAPIYQRWWFLVLANLVVVGLIVLSIYARNQKLKKDASLAAKLSAFELKALRAQINPHFIFNVLASIQRFILTNDKLAANEYLTKFSRLTRMTLNHSDKLLVPLEDELKSIEYYMELERLRLDMRFDFEIIVDADFDPTRLQIPPLILQTFIENAIWHGVAQLQSQGLVTVSVLGVDGYYHISIRDNGIGRQASHKTKSANHKSKGTTIVYEKLALLNQMHYGDDASIQFIDHHHEDGTPAGTEVLIILPHMQ